MKHGEYNLAVRQLDKMYMAKVVLDIDLVRLEDDPLERAAGDQIIPTLLIQFNPAFRDLEYQGFLTAIRFGAAYVWEDYPNNSQRRLKIYVSSIEGHHFTSPLLLAYVTALALLQALEWKPFKLPTFNPETGDVTFPRWLARYENGKSYLE